MATFDETNNDRERRERGGGEKIKQKFFFPLPTIDKCLFNFILTKFSLIKTSHDN